MEQPANSDRKLIICLVAGALLTLSPLFGLLATSVGMAGAFHSLRRSGIADPRFLSHSIDVAMLGTIVGLILCPIGVALLIYGLASYLRTRRRGARPMV